MENEAKFVDCERHERALLHMIGQVGEMRVLGATVAEIAGYMNVTKPTAKRYLERWVDEGKLITKKIKFGRFGKCQYWLSDDANEMYMCDEFKKAHELYAQRVLKVVV